MAFNLKRLGKVVLPSFFAQNCGAMFLPLWLSFFCLSTNAARRDKNNSSDFSTKKIESFIPSRNLTEINNENKNRSAESIDFSAWSLEEKIGQLLIVGYRSPQQIKSLKVGGIVLFSWNLGNSIEETRSKIESIKGIAQAHLKVPLFVATDHEGGRVLRIRKGMTPFPDAAAVGSVQDPFLAFQVGKHMGIELNSIGINMNFAPVLDLGNSRSFLGNRVWGDHSKAMAYSAVSFMRGQRAAGILAVAKHFPGHGLASVDSHFALPKVDKNKDELLNSDLRPFISAIGEGAQAFMTAHVEYPKIDKGPASLSKVFLDDILRKQLKFDGLIITDDLEMDGVKVDQASNGDVAIRALEAGSDMIMLVWSEKRQIEVVSAIKKAVESGRLSMAMIDEKLNRILRIKEERIGLKHSKEPNPFWKDNLRRPESLHIAQEVSQKAIKWWAGESNKLKGQFREQINEAWQVFVPAFKWQRLWKKHRAYDLIYRYSPKSDEGQKFLSRIEKSLERDTHPILLFTPPRREMDEELFGRLSLILGKAALKKNRKMPVLWVHQGPKPLRIKGEPKNLSLGIVSLFSASPLSFRNVQNLLEQPQGYF